MKLNFIFAILCTFLFTACELQQNISTPNKENQISENTVKMEEKTREPVSKELKLFIKDVINAFSAYDLVKINNKFIHPNYGYYDLYKIDGNISFTKQNEILNLTEEDNANEEINHLIKRIDKNAINYVIIEQNLDFNCSFDDDAYYGWDGEGLYLSEKTDNILLELMKKANEYEKDKYSLEELRKAKNIEKSAYKVILTPEIIFYINKIDKKWYITLFDRITTDCSSN